MNKLTVIAIAATLLSPVLWADTTPSGATTPATTSNAPAMKKGHHKHKHGVKKPASASTATTTPPAGSAQ